MATIAYAVATGGTLALWNPVFHGIPFALYFAAVAVAGWRAGWLAGISVGLAGTVTVLAVRGFPVELLSASAVLLGVSAVISLLVATRDRALRALADSERQNRLMVENVRDYAMFMTDAAGRVTRWNVGAERLLGWTEGEIVGESASAIFTPEDRAAGADTGEMETAARDGHAADERWHRRKDDSRFFGSGMMMRVDDAAGLHVGFTKVLRDDTERRRADDRARTILESVSDAFFALDADWRFTYANPQAERVLDRRPGDLLGKVLWEEYPGVPGTEFERVYRRVAAERVAGSFTAFYPDHARWYEVHAYPAPDRGLSVYFRDVTEAKRSEEQLRRSHDTFHHLIQNNPFGIYVVDSEFKLREVSLGAQQVFGGVRPLLGRDFAEVLRVVWTEPFATEAIRLFRHTLDTGEPYSAPATVEQRQDIAAVEAYDWRIERIVLPDGRFGVVCYFYDLSERQRWEAALRESGFRNAAVLETAMDCIVSMDHAGRVVEWNPAAERTFGYARDAVVGREMAKLIIPPALRDAHRAGLAKYLATGEGPVLGTRFEITAVRQDGTEFPVEVSITRVPGGDPPTFIGYLRDITERRQAEAALAEGEARFRQLAETIPQLAWMAKPDGYIFWYNRRWYEYTGTTPQQMEGWGWQAVHEPAELPRVMDGWQRSIRTGEPFQMEFPLRAADGTFRWFLTRVAPLRDAGGDITLWFGTNTDIEDQRRVADQRARLLESEQAARAEAERAGRMKDEFLATLSHELRTPLNSILGWAQILKGGPQGAADVSEGLAIIERNARAQAQIIEDLLDMSRIVSGKIRLEVRRVDLAAVVRAAVETVQPAADAKNIRVQTTLGSLKGPVSGDPDRLQQVFWNLLTNAIKFTPKAGRVAVVMERVNSHVEVAVTDTGEGIAAEFLPHVFDRFRQADGTTTRRHGGLGLGLAIVKQLVESHGGSVRVQSGGLGLGTTFTVTLPLTAVHPEPEALTERRHPERGPVPVLGETCVKIEGVRVLVVDDEPDARALVKRLLEDCGAVVTTAASADEAVERLSADRPDVAVFDIGMPGEDGYALIRRVRALAAASGGDVPAVALTAYARAEDRMKAMLAGFQQHLPKPVEPAELITVVAVLAGRRGR